MVGALLCETNRDDCVAAVIFFNNVGYLNGCVHGTIGVAQTLVHLGTIGVGDHGIETPVGRVVVRVDGSGTVAVRNVPSYRYVADLPFDVPGYGPIVGDIAWGGNWFFLVDNKSGIPLALEHSVALTDYAIAIRAVLDAQHITGANGEEIDHIEIFDAPSDPTEADSKNFVLCPGKVYDRSPCGTGTSAKLACLFAAGRLDEAQTWRQAGILDTVFHGFVEKDSDGNLIPTVSGRAFINGETTMIVDPSDPFRFGIPFHQPTKD
jgi:4-hydroxyproline epimerase